MAEIPFGDLATGPNEDIISGLMRLERCPVGRLLDREMRLCQLPSVA